MPPACFCSMFFMELRGNWTCLSDGAREHTAGSISTCVRSLMTQSGSPPVSPLGGASRRKRRRARWPSSSCRGCGPRSTLSPTPTCKLRAVQDGDRRVVDFVISDANPAACDACGLERGRLVGRKLPEVFPGHESAGLLDMCREVAVSGRSLILDSFRCRHGRDGGQRLFDIRAARAGDSPVYTWREAAASRECPQ